MCNHLYIFLLLLLGTSCISAQKPIATIHGHTFLLGDSLTIGLPHDNDPSGIYKHSLGRRKIWRSPPSQKANSRYISSPLK